MISIRIFGTPVKVKVTILIVIVALWGELAGWNYIGIQNAISGKVTHWVGNGDSSFVGRISDIRLPIFSVPALQGRRWMKCRYQRRGGCRVLSIGIMRFHQMYIGCAP